MLKQTSNPSPQKPFLTTQQERNSPGHGAVYSVSGDGSPGLCTEDHYPSVLQQGLFSVPDTEEEGEAILTFSSKVTSPLK